MEKSSKNYIRCENEPSQAAIQGFPPPRRIFHVVRGNVRVAGARQLAMATRQMEGGGWVICGLIPFDNGSSDWAQIQHEDGQWCSAPLLFRQDLPNLYW